MKTNYGLKIGVMSDLHLEFSQATLPEIPHCDILLIAGDTFVADEQRPRHVAMIHDCLISASDAANEVYIIAGNHEHYNGVFENTCDYIDELVGISARKNIKFLENEIHVSDRVAIYGATFWTDFNNDDFIAKRVASRRMNDFYCIKHSDMSLFTPDDAMSNNNACRGILLDFMRMEYSVPKIVLTHHASSFASINENYLGEINQNYAFANTGLDNTIAYSDITLWAHGHMHDACEYEIGNTKVICNPRGYPNQNPDWKFKIVEI